MGAFQPTHDELVGRACRWLLNSKRCYSVLAEREAWSTGERADAIGWEFWASHLVECKTSLSDFYADRSKRCRRAARQLGDRRWYLCRAGLIRPEQVRDGWGLLYATPGQVRLVVEAEKRERTTDELRVELRMIASAMGHANSGVIYASKRMAERIGEELVSTTTPDEDSEA